MGKERGKRWKKNSLRKVGCTHARILRWFYALFNAMHCIGQTTREKTGDAKRLSVLSHFRRTLYVQAQRYGDACRTIESSPQYHGADNHKYRVVVIDAAPVVNLRLFAMKLITFYSETEKICGKTQHIITTKYAGKLFLVHFCSSRLSVSDSSQTSKHLQGRGDLNQSVTCRPTCQRLPARYGCANGSCTVGNVRHEVGFKANIFKAKAKAEAAK